MLSQKLKEKLTDLIVQKYPALSIELIEPLVSENLLSSFHIELPQKILDQAQQFIRTIFNMREKSEYTNYFAPQLEALKLQDPGNKSILMSYDFHVDHNQQLKLIEINTNASFLAMGQLMYEVQELPTPITAFKMDNLKLNILEELQLNGKQIKKPRIAIVDEDPASQKLYVEFLVYAELFKKWDWAVDICDYRSLTTNFDFVYNRHTDFYFKSQESTSLKKWFNNKQMCFSPNPVEYFYLADKARMLDWNKSDFIKLLGLSEQEISIISAHLPTALDLNSNSAEKIWSQRKTLFFKPKQAFGAKQSYRGTKISRKTFDEIITQDFIAQEFVPAPELSFITPTGPQDFKYDLRFYVYKDQVQSVVARLYQGQVTNLKTPFGGFACVKFI